ncbi:BCCT family transporter [Eubacterium limosum]|uniref:BCCT family transporter n=1 Tax=Eubacterium limosum TaxID=1736 RepID=A0ABT5UR78_EUBLI|nr:BCCT family transporter [Eubacterium limosum]MCB6570595.1 BCCT family transporter [Eubacterium limosum]MDE1471203.1 BCCT family transporter [Eubacterium limosum]
MKSDKKSPFSMVNGWTFFPPLIFTVLLTAVVMSNPTVAGNVLETVFSFITDKFAWLFDWYYLALIVVVLILAFGPLGKKRFGNEKPEYSTLSWLGMIFTGAAGLGVLTWTSVEWLYTYQSPMWGVETGTVEALQQAAMMPLFHWGPVFYLGYALIAVLFAYQFYCKKVDDTLPSTACISLLGKKRARGGLGKTIDIIYIVALLSSVVTCVGVNVPTLVAIITNIIGYEPPFIVSIVLIMAWSIIMAVLLFAGLKKGIGLLSNIRVYVGFGILVFVLLFGPSFFMLNSFTDGLGMLMQNTLHLVCNTDPYAKSGIPQNWTVFYYAWYITMSIQNGVFYGRISKGRTVRELVLGLLGATVIGTYMFFIVFQGFSINTFLEQGLDLGSILAEGGQGAAIAAIWKYLPFAGILMPVLFVFANICMQTLLNANAYSMAMSTTKVLKSGQEPPSWIKIFWSLCIGVISIALLMIGGIRPFQTITVICGVPALVIIALMALSFFKDIRKNGWRQSGENSSDKIPGAPHESTETADPNS